MIGLYNTSEKPAGPDGNAKSLCEAMGWPYPAILLYTELENDPKVVEYVKHITEMLGVKPAVVRHHSCTLEMVYTILTKQYEEDIRQRANTFEHERWRTRYEEEHAGKSCKLPIDKLDRDALIEHMCSLIDTPDARLRHLFKDVPGYAEKKGKATKGEMFKMLLMHQLATGTKAK